MLEQGNLMKLELIERQVLTVNGVSNVESFDESKVILQTNLGLLVVKGEGLNVTALNLDEGQLTIQGIVGGLEYLEDKNAKMRAKGKNMLSKFMR